MWEKLSRTRTGLMDREAAGELDDSGEWGITDKVEPPPVMRRLKPSEMTEEQWEIYEAEYREAYEEWEARQNDAGNPETGEWKGSTPSTTGRGTANVTLVSRCHAQ